MGSCNSCPSKGTCGKDEQSCGIVNNPQNKIKNIIVFIYHFYKIFKYKRNPFKEDVHFDLKAFSATLFEATINNSI